MLINDAPIFGGSSGRKCADECVPIFGGLSRSMGGLNIQDDTSATGIFGSGSRTTSASNIFGGSRATSMGNLFDGSTANSMGNIFGGDGGGASSASMNNIFVGGGDSFNNYRDVQESSLGKNADEDLIFPQLDHLFNELEVDGKKENFFI